MVIYRILNLLNNKEYIGQTIQKFKYRKNRHIKDLNGNKHVNSILQRSWNKNGETYFEFSILEMVDNKDLLNERERFYIKKHNTTNSDCGYNIKEGGINDKFNVLGKENIKKSRLNRRKKYVCINPLGDTFTITGLKDICLKNNLNLSIMVRIAKSNQAILNKTKTRRQKNKTCENWECFYVDDFNQLKNFEKSKNNKRRYLFISPEGIYFTVNNLREFCKSKKLDSSTMSKIANKKGRNTHKNWTCQYK